MQETLVTEICPHCKRWVKLRLIAKHVYDQELGHAWDREEHSLTFPAAYFVFSCGTCEEIVLYYWDEPRWLYTSDDLEQVFIEDVREQLLEEESDLSMPYIVWPPSADGRSLSETVPDAVRRLHKTAQRLKNKEPNLFAVQIGRALEVICREHGATTQGLSRMLRELAAQGVFPPTLAEIAKALKDTRNKGAHADVIGVSREDAEAIDELFHLIIGYVYEAPAKLDAYRQLLSNLIQESDDRTIH